ncbi:uncharacterized protein K02A2.6-like [Entelurus aequoreus]|uniref:uncharacterized protein K02A2.6-like n=1 Tax=Entelurus aequoreus TaxID=161455 RepID=UPI002B1E5ABC|nr:uncharacterized protein K02A2.6-like [Entelurus aequoreus]
MDLKSPESLKLTGNVDENWRTFKQQFHLYIAAMGHETKPEARKVALLLTIAGPQAIEVFNTFVFDTPDDNGKLDVVLSKFDAHCSPKKNETYERYVFLSRTQRQHEPFDSFLTDLRLKAQSCNFATLKDSMIRDQIVFGVEDKKVRERLLREMELTLAGAIKICQASELSQKHVRTFSEMSAVASAQSDNAAAVGAVSYQRRQRTQTRPARQSEDEMISCKRCGTKHKPRQCPAFGKQCSSCQGKNHFAKQCFSKWKEGKKGKTVNIVDEPDLSDTFFVGMVNLESEQISKPDNVNDVTGEDTWIAPLMINGTVVTMRLETGAKANLISMCDVKAMKNKPQIKRKESGLKDYNGQPIKCLGTCRLSVTVKGKVHHLCFFVVNEGRESLLGDRACEELALVKRVYSIIPKNDSMETIVQNFSDVFKGFGVLPFTYKIQLKEDAQPVVHAARRVPAPLKDSLKKELDRMIMLGVIKKVNEPTDWVNSMVITKKKNGELRICMDPKDLNESIKREHYQIPTREEIISEMSGASYFTKLDASQGFWQLKLSESSTMYCTFNTPFGRHCFLRLPFGIKSAPEIFHRAMEQIIEGLDGVRVYIDDIIIWGSTAQEYNERLNRVMERIKKYGLKLNKSKCEFGVQEILFLGDKLSARGVQPDQEKMCAIQNMPRPTDKTGVLRIMGMVNFIGKFIPNLTAKTSCIRELLHKDGDFKWTVKHEHEWQKLKNTLTTAPVLSFYDHTKRIKVSTDASKDGIGAVLLQAEGEHWKPVAYASRAMTKSECRYAQIEKECLGLAYGLERFHSYVYGLPSFTVETDHRPLVAIIKKNLNEMSPRIQRLMMKMQRATTDDSVSATDEDIQCHVNMVSATLPVSDTKSRQIAEATATDAELQHVMRNMDEGWPAGSCPLFYHVRGELSTVDGLLLKKGRIVIPQALRMDILHRIHEGHLGIEKCKRRARESVFWPGLNKDIETLINKCETCQKHRNKQSKEPMVVAEVPTAPWHKVGMDLFHLRGKDYLAVVDYYSNFPEMALLAGLTSTCVITHAKSIFARHGIPHTVVSDNGPCFSSKEWQKFAVQYDFQHVTSNPHYAQSNGQAEKGVHILKQLLKKAADSDSDPYLALLSYRASPLQCGLSPAELLMKRKLRTTLPSHSNNIIKQNNPSKIEHKLRQQKMMQKSFYDKTTKRLPPLTTNNTVRIEDTDGWSTKATVLQEVAPRSYTVRTDDGQILRRNRRSLLKTPQGTVGELSVTCGESQVIPTPVMDCNADCNTPTPNEPELRRSTREIKRPDGLNL